MHSSSHTAEKRLILSQDATHKGFQLSLVAACRRRVEHRRVALSLNTEVNHQCGVTTVVNDEIGQLSALEPHSLKRTPPVVCQRLTLPGKNTHAVAGDGCRRMVLCGVDVT